MSDSVKKWHEMQEERDHWEKLITKGVNIEDALSKEQKLLDIDQALKEYEGNLIDKWDLINRIEKTMSR